MKSRYERHERVYTQVSQTKTLIVATLNKKQKIIYKKILTVFNYFTSRVCQYYNFKRFLFILVRLFIKFGYKIKIGNVSYLCCNLQSGWNF